MTFAGAGSPRLGELTSPELDALDPTSRVLVVPLGSTEQHGPHLPLSTDTDLAVVLCDRLAQRRADVVVAPVLAYGASGEHAGFAGTLSIGSEVLESVIVELVRSATDTFSRVLLVSSHGGNATAISAAVQRLVAESRDVRIFTPRWTGDLHAGHTETSMMLAASSAAVRQNLIAPGRVGSLDQLWPALRRGGVRAVSESGVLGDPTTATKAAGEALITQLVSELVEAVSQWDRATALEPVEVSS